MRCCVSFCENTLENVSNDMGVSFYNFPNEPHLHAAWLVGLDLQDSLLPDSAVVCSQHFLNEQFSVTGDGSKHLREDAAPSAVLVCQLCLNRDSDLVSFVKCNLQEAYESLTGHILLDEEILKQTLCTECAQRLFNFSQFKYRSLRARCLLMDVVKEHKSITLQHMKLINHELNTEKSNILSSTLVTECDLNMHAHVDEGKHMVLDDAVCDAVDDVSEKTKIKSRFPQHAKETMLEIKTETLGDYGDNFANDVSHDSVLLEMNKGLRMALLERNLNVKEHVNNENTMLKCKVYFEGFPNEDTHNKHVEINHMGHIYSDDDDKSALQDLLPPPTKHEVTLEELREDAPSYCHNTPPSQLPLEHLTGYRRKEHPTIDTNEQMLDIYVPLNEQSYTNSRTYDEHNLKECFVKLHDVLQSPNIIARNESGYLSKTPMRYVVKEFNSPSKITTEIMSESKKRKTVRRVGTKKELSSTLASNAKGGMKTSQTGRKYICEFCDRQFICYTIYRIHIRRTHTGEKPYSCKLCQYKCLYRSLLVNHMRTHTGEKPFSCKLCDYKCAQRSHLVYHTRTHTGEKPYSCQLCQYKCSDRGSLVKHMRTHTGEKPYSCSLCEYKCSQPGHLACHMRTHTGEKPYSCKLCQYKCSHHSHLVNHMRTHTGERPFSCKLCEFKSSQRRNLENHMRTHTGEKPYSCELCEYRCSQKCCLVKHMRTHTELKARTITA